MIYSILSLVKSKEDYGRLEARKAGHCGITLFHEITGLSRATITRGLNQIKTTKDLIIHNKDDLKSGERV